MITHITSQCINTSQTQLVRNRHLEPSNNTSKNRWTTNFIVLIFWKYSYTTLATLAHFFSHWSSMKQVFISYFLCFNKIIHRDRVHTKLHNSFDHNVNHKEKFKVKSILKAMVCQQVSVSTVTHCSIQPQQFLK